MQGTRWAEAASDAHDILHRASNGGLNRGTHRAGVGELKAEMRRARDILAEAIAEAKARPIIKATILGKTETTPRVVTFTIVVDSYYVRVLDLLREHGTVAYAFGRFTGHAIDVSFHLNRDRDDMAILAQTLADIGVTLPETLPEKEP